MFDNTRITVPWHPHYIVHRAVEGQALFGSTADCLTYLYLMTEEILKHQLDLWCWCLLPDHVHLVGVPRRSSTLTKAIGNGHRRYARRFNHGHNRKGPLWRGRFASFPMAENVALEAVRYVETNPVAAGQVESPEEYLWSSAQAHAIGNRDLLSRSLEVLDKVESWESFLRAEPELDPSLFRAHEKSGRPLGPPGFAEKLKQTSEHDSHFPTAAWRREHRPDDERGGTFFWSWSDD